MQKSRKTKFREIIFFVLDLNVSQIVILTHLDCQTINKYET
jgi:carbonic anhydrase